MTIEPDPITASTHEGQLKAWFGQSVSNLDAIIKKGQREFQDSQEDWAEFKDYEKRNMAFRAGFEMAMNVVTESANGKLTDLGYRWNGTAWTDEPTAEQRLEAMRKVIEENSLVAVCFGMIRESGRRPPGRVGEEAMTYAAWALEDQAGSDCPLWFVSDAKEMSRPADCREWSVSLNATEFPDRGESAAKIIAEALNAKLEKKP